MNDTFMANRATAAKAAPAPVRRRRWPRWLMAIGGFALIQCITITPAIVVRYVDEATGAPLAQLPVTAVWRLHTASAGGSSAGSVLKVEEQRINANGELRLGAAVMLHWPVAPFGFSVREARSLPTLYVADDVYEPSIVGSLPESYGEQLPVSFMLLQRTSINGSTEKLAKADQREIDPTLYDDRAYFRTMVEQQIEQASWSCGRRFLCQKDGE